MAVLHCRVCSIDTHVAENVVGMICESCGLMVFRPDFERELEQKLENQKALADRTGGVLRVVCPLCGVRNEFPDFEMVRIFLCQECDEMALAQETRSMRRRCYRTWYSYCR